MFYHNKHCLFTNTHKMNIIWRVTGCIFKIISDFEIINSINILPRLSIRHPERSTGNYQYMCSARYLSRYGLRIILTEVGLHKFRRLGCTYLNRFWKSITVNRSIASNRKFFLYHSSKTDTVLLQFYKFSQISAIIAFLVNTYP